MTNTFNFSEVWNKALESRLDRPMTSRDRIWASELGKSYLDRWLKMRGVEPSNPPNPRSLRKFEAGNFFEWFVGFILQRSGVKFGTQEWVEFSYPGLLNVTGKIDYLVTGVPERGDTAKAMAHETAKQYGLPELFTRVSDGIIDYLVKRFPAGVTPTVLEIKSVSEFQFDRCEESQQADPMHTLQCFHYIKAKQLPEGHVVYICREDMRLNEFPVYNNAETEKIYRDDIEKMTAYHRATEQPPKDQEVVYDPLSNKFAANWKVAYSYYLTKVYGYKDQAEFDDKWKPLTGRWNRVLARIKQGKNMTADNTSAIIDMEKVYPDIYKAIINLKPKENKV